jgi:hypothetical protein
VAAAPDGVPMRPRDLAWAPLLLLAVTACSNSSVAAAAPTCQPASQALLGRIAELAPASHLFTVQKAAGERAANSPATWWVAVRFTVRGSAVPKTGIWAVGGGLDGKGTLLAVDPVAQQWSTALHADTSASKIPATSGTAVLRCL